MKLLMAPVLAALLVAGSSLAGTWRGTIQVNGQSLRLVLHVTDSGAESYSATVDSPDQGVDGIPVQNFSVVEKDVLFTMKTVGAVYLGKAGADGTLSGTFQQGGVLPLTLKRDGGQVASLAGDWKGTLNVQGQSLRLVFHLKKGAAGAYTGTVDSIDQNALAIPVQDIYLTDQNVRLQASTIGGVFTGKILKSGDEITGEWWQGPRAPLILKKG